MPFRNTIANRLIVFALGVFFALFALEAGLRVLGSRYSAQKPPAAVRDPNAYTVLCIGDSFVFGLGAPADKSYPRQLEEMMNAQGPGRRVKVINNGVPGENTSQIYERFARTVDVIRPDLVVFLGGLNNSSSYYGFHAYRSGNGFLARLADQGERVRILKYIRLAAMNIRRKQRDFNRHEVAGSPQAQQYADAAAQKQRENKRQEAIALALKAVEIDPSYSPAYQTLGALYLSEGQILQAAQFYQKYCDVTGDPIAAYQLGSIYLSLQDYPRAFRTFVRGLESDRSSKNFCLGGLFWLLETAAPGDVRSETAAYLRKIRGRMDNDGKEIIDRALGTNDLPGDLDAWREHDIRRIAGECRKRNIPLILVDYPERETATGKAAAALALPCVDNKKVFDELLRREPHSKYFSSDADHCSSEGYRVVAENVYNKIRELRLTDK